MVPSLTSAKSSLFGVATRWIVGCPQTRLEFFDQTLIVKEYQLRYKPSGCKRRDLRCSLEGSLTDKILPSNDQIFGDSHPEDLLVLTVL